MKRIPPNTPLMSLTTPASTSGAGHTLLTVALIPAHISALRHRPILGIRCVVCDFYTRSGGRSPSVPNLYILFLRIPALLDAKASRPPVASPQPYHASRCRESPHAERTGAGSKSPSWTRTSFIDLQRCSSTRYVEHSYAGHGGGGPCSFVSHPHCSRLCFCTFQTQQFQRRSESVPDAYPKPSKSVFRLLDPFIPVSILRVVREYKEHFHFSGDAVPVTH
jgi:hypothetical protein